MTFKIDLTTVDKQTEGKTDISTRNHESSLFQKLVFERHGKTFKFHIALDYYMRIKHYTSYFQILARTRTEN